MSVMKVRSFNKKGEEIQMKDIVLENENIYKILRKYIKKDNLVKTEIKKPVKV